METSEETESTTHGPEEQRAAVMNVLALMMSDRRATDSEMGVLEMVRQRVGMTEENFLDLLEHPRQTHFVVPEAEEERVSQIRDMALMIAADGSADDEQVEAAVGAAVHFGFSPTLMTSLIRRALTDHDSLFAEPLDPTAIG